RKRQRNSPWTGLKPPGGQTICPAKGLNALGRATVLPSGGDKSLEWATGLPWEELRWPPEGKRAAPRRAEYPPGSRRVALLRRPHLHRLRAATGLDGGDAGGHRGAVAEGGVLSGDSADARVAVFADGDHPHEFLLPIGAFLLAAGGAVLDVRVAGE